MGFSSSDLVMRARDSVYHIECFRCSVCSRQLLPGDEFSLREHELLCRTDHGLLLERAAAGSPHSPGPLPTRGLHLSGEPSPRGPVCGAAGAGTKVVPAVCSCGCRTAGDAAECVVCGEAACGSLRAEMA